MTESVFSRDLATDLPKALSRIGTRRALVVAHPSRRFVDRATAALGETPHAVFDGARVHVPRDVVSSASEALRSARADTVVSVGGGSAIGLAKALRLEHDVRFVAVPTTYSGSEQTSIYGIRDGAEKTTGRDPRVRPDVAIYEASLTSELPEKLTTQSLLNALAHPVSTLSSGSLDDEARAEALDTARALVLALEELADAPHDLGARGAAQRAGARAGAVLERGVLGAHHRAAHRLGGRFDLGHAALHSALLPHTVRRLAEDAPDRFEELAGAVRAPDLPGHLVDLLRRAGAETSLLALGATRAETDALLREDPDLPAVLVRGALHGGRVSARVRTEDWGLAEPLRAAGPALPRARVAVVALHGRGSNAYDIAKRVFEITGDAPDVAVLAPQAPEGRWYPKHYTAPPGEQAGDLEAALAEVERVVDRALGSIAAERLFIAGFSQGACLAAEYVARSERAPGGLLALSGARIGPPETQPAVAADLTGVPVLLGASERDPFIRAADIDAAASALRGAGASVEVVMTPGEGHAIPFTQRIRARELLLDRDCRATTGGFGNARESEALPSALPRDQNSPRRVPYGLYAEQVNATGFTAPRGENRRAWLYRIRPSAQASPLAPLAHPRYALDPASRPAEPNLLGWRPTPIPEEPTDFVDGLAAIAGAGNPRLRRGCAIRAYAANRSMEDRAFCSADGDLLLVPERGRLVLATELGALEAAPGQIAILPRGLRVSVLLRDESARGWLAEAYGPGFRLPERGPVGANGLADPRHFRAPVAYVEDRLSPGYRIAVSFMGELFEARQDHSPLDVAAWHGTLAPYVYDLSAFSPVYNALVDHADPSIFTVLSAPLDEQGAHNLDFVFFPPRWDATEGTFRPPYFHRNAVTELNGVIREPGAAGDTAFRAGGYFLTPPMTPHGVRAGIIERALAMTDEEADAPRRHSERSMWFQFETTLPLSLSTWALEGDHRIRDFRRAFGTYRAHYRPPDGSGDR